MANEARGDATPRSQRADHSVLWEATSISTDANDAVEFTDGQGETVVQIETRTLPQIVLYVEASGADAGWNLDEAMGLNPNDSDFNSVASGTVSNGVKSKVVVQDIDGSHCRVRLDSEGHSVWLVQRGSGPSAQTISDETLTTDGPARETVGTQQISVGSTGSTDIDPANNGVSGSVCEAVIQNNGDVNVWVAPSGTGATQGTELLPGDTLTEKGFKAGTHTEIHVPTAGSGNVDVRFREEV